MYTGRLIESLIEAVEKAERAAETIVVQTKQPEMEDESCRLLCEEYIPRK
jgi:hypothetical protein